MKQRNVTSVDIEMGSTKILILGFCLTLVSAQVLQVNDLQRILRSYLNDLKLNSNAIFAQKITEVTIFSLLNLNHRVKCCLQWGGSASFTVYHLPYELEMGPLFWPF